MEHIEKDKQLKIRINEIEHSIKHYDATVTKNKSADAKDFNEN